jgi:plasmid stabilization system protein ParE
MSAPKRHPLVKADIEESARWYEEQKAGLGEAFVDEVKRVIQNIGARPVRNSIRFGNWRRANLRRFPYAVFYQVFDTEVIIFAVLHSRREQHAVLERRVGKA